MQERLEIWSEMSKVLIFYELKKRKFPVSKFNEMSIIISNNIDGSFIAAKVLFVFIKHLLNKLNTET